MVCLTVLAIRSLVESLVRAALTSLSGTAFLACRGKTPAVACGSTRMLEPQRRHRSKMDSGSTIEFPQLGFRLAEASGHLILGSVISTETASRTWSPARIVAIRSRFIFSRAQGRTV